MTQQVMENGVLRQMTSQELADYNALQDAWPAVQAAQAAKTALPDTDAQIANLAAAVVALGGSLPDDQITAANATLSAIGQQKISIAQPVVAAKLG